MSKEDADLFRRLLACAYDAGVIDGLREAIPGRREEIEGREAAVNRVCELYTSAIVATHEA